MEPYKQDKKKYFCLLRELILNKQEAECETSFEDKFNDIKKHMINELTTIQKIRFDLLLPLFLFPFLIIFNLFLNLFISLCQYKKWKCME